MHIIAAQDLAEKAFLSVEVLLKRGSLRPRKLNVIVFRFNGEVYAYVNHCMHMHRPLNCSEDAIFDANLQYLRCSMHGFLFEPESGTCISPVCEGQKLQAFKVVEEAGKLVFKEKSLQVLKVSLPGQELI